MALIVKMRADEVPLRIASLDTEQFNEKVADITKDELELKTDKPTLVDFYAQWCGPCKTLEPVLEKVYSKMRDDIDVYKVDIEKGQDVAIAFGVMSVPTLLFLPTSDSNKKPTKMPGAPTEEHLIELINEKMLEGEVDDSKG